MVTVSRIRARVTSLRKWLGVLEDGLNGNPHALGEGEGDYFQKFVATLDLELISQTAAAKRGLVLRRRAKPICSRYYPQPIGQYHGLYLIEQFKEKGSA